jgi:hypothetical protein
LKARDRARFPLLLAQWPRTALELARLWSLAAILSSSKAIPVPAELSCWPARSVSIRTSVRWGVRRSHSRMRIHSSMVFERVALFIFQKRERERKRSCLNFMIYHSFTIFLPVVSCFKREWHSPYMVIPALLVLYSNSLLLATEK